MWRQESDKKLKARLEGPFDAPELPVGHRERFARLLNRQESKRGRFRRRTIAWVSAVVAASLMIAFVAVERTHLRDSAACGESAEVAEMTGYYGALIFEEMERITDLLPEIDDHSRTEILNDLNTMRRDEKEFLHSSSGQMAEEEQIAYLVMCYDRQLKTLKLLYSLLEVSIK